MGDIARQGDAATSASPDTVPADVQQLTPLDELRAQVAEELEKPRLFKKFPRAGGRLAGEFRPSNKREVREAAAAENDEYILTECLVNIHVHDPEHEDAGPNGLVPLAKWAHRPELEPLRFDNRLCEVIGLPPLGAPSKIALALYENNDLALAEAAGEVAQWSLNTHTKVYDDFTRAS